MLLLKYNTLIVVQSSVFCSFQAKESLSGSSYSDYLVFSRAVLGWRRVQQEGDREDRDEYLDKYTLSRNSLRFVNGPFKAHTLV